MRFAYPPYELANYRSLQWTNENSTVALRVGQEIQLSDQELNGDDGDSFGKRLFTRPVDLTLVAVICVFAAGLLPYVHVHTWTNGNELSLNGFQVQQGRLFITLAAYGGSYFSRVSPSTGLPTKWCDYVALGISGYSLLKILDLFRVLNLSFLGTNLSFSPSNLVSPGIGVLALGAAFFLLCRAMYLERGFMLG